MVEITRGALQQEVSVEESDETIYELLGVSTTTVSSSRSITPNLGPIIALILLLSSILSLLRCCDKH